MLQNQLAVPLKLTPKFESSGGNSLNVGIWADMLIARGKTILIPHFWFVGTPLTFLPAYSVQ